MEDDVITLLLGDAEEFVCESVEEAVERVMAHAAETDADPDVRGAIHELAVWLQGMLTEESDLLAVARGMDDEIDGEARHLGLVPRDTAAYETASGRSVDLSPLGTELGFFEDDNGLLWALYVADGATVAYREVILEG